MIRMRFRQARRKFKGKIALCIIDHVLLVNPETRTPETAAPGQPARSPTPCWRSARNSAATCSGFASSTSRTSPSGRKEADQGRPSMVSELGAQRRQHPLYSPADPPRADHGARAHTASESPAEHGSGWKHGGMKRERIENQGALCWSTWSATARPATRSTSCSTARPPRSPNAPVPTQQGDDAMSNIVQLPYRGVEKRETTTASGARLWIALQGGGSPGRSAAILETNG